MSTQVADTNEKHHVRAIIRSLLLRLIISVPSNGQEEPAAADAPAAESLPNSFVVRITEFRFRSPARETRTADDIVQRIRNRNAEDKAPPVGTIRVSALSGAETMA